MLTWVSQFMKSRSFKWLPCFFSPGWRCQLKHCPVLSGHLSTREITLVDAVSFQMAEVCFLLKPSCLVSHLTLALWPHQAAFGMPAKEAPTRPDLPAPAPLEGARLHRRQLTCLVLLWAIKASAAAVVFPMMVSLFSRSLLPAVNSDVFVCWYLVVFY